MDSGKKCESGGTAKAARRTFTFGGVTYATKKAAKDAVRALVARQALGVMLGPEDDQVVRDLLGMHPEADKKIDCGVRGFTVRLDPEWRRNRQIILHRVDGTSSDFSWHACIDGANPLRDIREAFRRAVVDQVLAFRDAQLAAGAVCPFRGVALTARTSHVDHEAPRTFARLLEDFLAGEGMALADVPITPSADNQLWADLADAGLSARWQDYHRANARLRLLSRGANLSEARRG